MANKHLVRRSFAWTVVFTSLFVLTLGAVLISLVVGDWIFWKTNDYVLSWFVGSVVLVGFLATLGSGIGFWLWTKGSNVDTEVTDKTDSMDRILNDMSIERD